MSKTAIHAHEILRMMEGNTYASTQELRAAILSKFGEEARFHTCSAEGLDADEIVSFLTNKGKFKPTADGFTMDRDRVCDTY